MQNMTIEEIKEHINTHQQLTEEFLALLTQDSRAGVKKIYHRLLQQKEKKYNEERRTYQLYSYERELTQKGYSLIAGIDEVGRGPLAGPVVAAAVILPQDEYILGLNDSKKLSEDKREELNSVIRSKAISYSFGIVEASEIDEINIYQATLKAMSLAVETLNRQPKHLLIDALRLPKVQISQTAIVGGDGKSSSIAAASILAKVYRDDLMRKYDREYPQYGFIHNKGYGTKEHLEALDKYGPCVIHRRSFKCC